MAFFLVSAVPRQELMEDLSARLQRDEFTPLRPFGPTLSRSLKAARQRRNGGAVWDEEDYCRPRLAEERAAVLDRYFFDLRVEPVSEKAGNGSSPWRVSFPNSRTDESHLARAQSRTTYGS